MQFLTALHQLQFRVFQAGLTTFQSVEFVLYLGKFLRVGTAGGQQGSITVLALAHGSHLGVQLGDLLIQVFQRDGQRAHLVEDGALLRL
ncbi:Uncharacterised protein [Mycobacteroides abscessus subsp. abscessus]|nr:Uncharacterised protein [Mycobacteroides abscessus subsp. abscessus]